MHSITRLRRPWLKAPGLALLLIPSVLIGQPVPVGPEFRVNTVTTSNQRYPAVSGAPTGEFVVVWVSDTSDGRSRGSFVGDVFAQRFASSGQPQGGETQVNLYATGVQNHPDVSTAPDGSFVIVWHGDLQDGDRMGVFGRRYSSLGLIQANEFQINTYTTDRQRDPSVSHAPNGDFVVVWHSGDGQDGETYGVFGQRFASSGDRQGEEFQINTWTSNEQYRAEVSHAPAGGFVVVWESLTGAGDAYRGIFARRYASSGQALDSEFLVNTSTSNKQRFPSLSHSASGEFVIVWNSYDQDGDLYGVFGQRYSSTGERTGGEFQGNVFTPGYQFSTGVSHSTNGDFIIVWSSTSRVHS
jgi:hypothetical protein